MQDYISVDLETTGLSPETSDIIEIGAWKVKSGEVVDKFVTLVRPIIYIPRTIQEMTGITMEDVAECQTIEPILLDFFDWCGDLPFIGHNLPFDFGFLCYKGKPIGLDFTLKGMRQGIDTLSLSKQYLHLENNKLATVAKSFGIEMKEGNERGEYHRAGYDSYVTKLVYDKFLYSLPNILSVTTPSFLTLKDEKYGKATNMDTLGFV